MNTTQDNKGANLEAPRQAADLYNGPRNLDRVICYTWERKRGGPSGEFEEAASAVV
jgi:hypothetical protein